MSAKGTTWSKKDHKYDHKEGDRYIYKQNYGDKVIKYGKLGEEPIQYGGKKTPKLSNKKFQADLDNKLASSKNPLAKGLKGIRDFLNKPVSEVARDTIKAGDMTIKAFSKKKVK